MQCHVEMTADLVDTWCRAAPDELPRVSTPALMSEADIRDRLDARVGALHDVAAAIYARWATMLRS